MATQKALITNKTDFIEAGIGANKLAPALFLNMEDMPGDVTIIGAPQYVDGVRGKAIDFNNVSFLRKPNHLFSGRKDMFSFWTKIPPEAFVDGKWTIFLSTRSHPGLSDRGYHLAMYQSATGGSGQIHARAYGTASDSKESQLVTGFRALPDTLYHVVFYYEEVPSTGSYRMRVYFNNQLVNYGSVSVTMPPDFIRNLQIGNFSTTDAITYPASIMMDEFIHLKDDAIWTQAQREQYYNDILAKKFLDYSRTPGSLELPLPIDNVVREWRSGVIDLGTGFSDYGKAHIVGNIPEDTFINVSTASSSDGVTFDEWAPVGQDELIHSINKRFLKVKVEMGTQYIGASPRLDEIQILDFAKPARINLTTEPIKLYRDLASGLESLGILQNDYDTLIEEQVNGEELLSFKLPLNDPKRKELGSEAVEIIAEIGRRRFTIKEMKDKRDDSGKAYTEFKGEALWYEIGDLKVPSIDLTETTPYEAMSFALANCIPSTDWTLDRVEIADKRRTIRGTWTSVLAIFRDVQATFGGELVFDTTDKTISLIAAQGQDNGVRFYYGKNLKNVERTVDTFSLVTRLYPQGKGDLTISTVNGGLDFIEDTQWVDALGLRNRIRADVWKDDRYVIPQNLYDDGVSLLTEAAKPAVNYTLNVQDLSRLSGHEHESFELGDTIYAVDREILNLELPSRIMRRKYNVREPWKTQVELEQPKKQLAEAKVRAFDDSLTQLAETDPLDTEDVKQMTVFNHLLNSRADEGLVDWVADSADIQAVRTGFSGENSFKFTAAYGQKKTLSQKIYGVSHRTAYTVSAQVAFDGEITRGGTLPDPFVGIYVVITYDDGTTERKPLNVKDVTSTPTTP